MTPITAVRSAADGEANILETASVRGVVVPEASTRPLVWRNRGQRQMLGIDAIYDQRHALHCLSLADGLANVKSVRSLKSASDHPAELLADFSVKV
jgi:hypothetical protein